MYLKQALIAFALAASAGAHAQDNTDSLVRGAYLAAGRDLGSTALGLAQGFGEANPLGLAMIPLHALAIHMSDKQDEPQRTNDLTTITSVWDGVALSNAALLVGVPVVGAFAMAAAYMVHSYKADQPIRDEAVKRADFALQCARFMAGGMDRNCVYNKAPT